MLLGKIASKAWSLPPARNEVTITRGIRIPMSDGTELIADHYSPVTRRPAATVLVRTPYGLSMPASLQNAHLIAERGYHVLYVSCRGTCGSGGAFDPGRHEAADGQDCVAWLRERDWFDGRLVTFGMSYLGFAQWALAMDPPPELRAAVVLVGLHEFGRSVHGGGPFGLHNTLSWAGHMAVQERGRPADRLMRLAVGDRRLRAAMAANPIADAARTLLRGESEWFEDWMSSRADDPYWEPRSCAAALEKIEAPVLLVGGWQDLFLRQTLAQYRALSERGVTTRLVVGPWAHLDVAVRGGGVVMREALEWLDRYAGPDAPEVSAGGQASVRVHVGGAGWRDLAGWPPPASAGQPWGLRPGGRLVPPGTPREDPDAGDRFRYDPSDPTPAVGGAIMSRGAGVRDNRGLEARPDVLVYTSEPLQAPLEVAGEVIAEIDLERDNPYADVFVRLCDVSPDGRSANVCDGIVRLTGGDPLRSTVTVSASSAAHRFAPGHRVRVQVSGGAHPRFARNPGTGALDAGPAELRDTRYRVRPDSAVILPVLRPPG
ncbi:MAG: CocE/NonD family hydrolase [Actinomycetia bacterium]|nr:CocE/NonD family hydrolase [Actinomycetes bacterium]